MRRALSDEERVKNREAWERWVTSPTGLTLEAEIANLQAFLNPPNDAELRAVLARLRPWPGRRDVEQRRQDIEELASDLAPLLVPRGVVPGDVHAIARELLRATRYTRISAGALADYARNIHYNVTHERPPDASVYDGSRNVFLAYFERRGVPRATVYRLLKRYGEVNADTGRYLPISDVRARIEEHLAERDRHRATIASLVAGGRSPAAARRWAELHRGATPDQAPRPRRRRSAVADK